MNLPRPQSLAERLFSGPLRLPSGAWLSWLSDDASGFPYPEATAVAVRTGLWWHRHHPDWPLLSLIPELRYLEQSTDARGIVLQAGRGYLFDTALVLAALAEADRAAVPGSFRPLLALLRGSVPELLRRRHAVCGGPVGNTWSTRFGPHQLKSLALAVQAGALAPDDPVVRSVVEELVGFQQEDGGFRHPEDDDVLLHAHCYALEGLHMLSAAALPEDFPVLAVRGSLASGLAFLVARQNRDGTFPSRTAAASEAAGDVTAQAGRLFALAGFDLEPRTLERTDRGLAACMAPCGLVRHASGADHRNSWASLFALQYLWVRSGGLLRREDIS